MVKPGSSRVQADEVERKRVEQTPLYVMALPRSSSRNDSAMSPVWFRDDNSCRDAAVQHDRVQSVTSDA